MATVQLQCGSCNKLMAISTAHLGGQVRCPHCQAVVQAPPRAPTATNVSSAPTELLPPIEARDVDSIFAPAEPGDDLFDAGPRRPLLERPPDTMPVAPAPPPVDQQGVTVDVFPPVQHDITEALPAPVPAPPSAESEVEPHADLTALARPRPAVDRGYLSLMLLIFLVPYSILMTLFVIYLWYQLANQESPLLNLPDPAPKKDGARQVLRTAHDQPLAANQKVRLGSDLTIGAIKVTPEKVTREVTTGNLQLVLDVKNVSSNQVFSPMHMDFLRTSKGNKSVPPPYTFLDSRRFVRIYGGLVWFERPGEADKTNEGELQPGQQEKVVVTAPHNEELVKNIVNSNENLTWRVQLRRGLVRVGGQQVSATAVIGVQFNANEIR